MNYRAVLGLWNVQVRPLKTEGVAMDVNISTTQLYHLLPAEILSKRFNLCLSILLCKLEKNHCPILQGVEASAWYTLATVINDSVLLPLVSDWGLTIHFKLHLRSALLSCYFI